MWYLVQRRSTRPREEWTVTLEQHLAWMKRQHEAGTIIMSGPTRDRKMGMYLIRAESRQEAERIAASDPYTEAGFCSFEIFEWEIHQILGVGPFSEAEIRAHRTS